MYRPQFAYPDPPPPCQDQRCMYSFSFVNTPGLNRTLDVGQQTGKIPLRLDKDADFYLRGITQQGDGSIRLEDCDGNALSDSENLIESTNFELPDQYSNTAGAGIVTLDSGVDGVFMPAGGNFVVYIYNPTLSQITLPTINLHGVKRYYGAGCK